MWSSGAGIWFAVLSSLPVLNDEVHAGKVLRPTGLASREMLAGGEIDKVLMVRDDLDGVAGPLEVSSQVF